MKEEVKVTLVAISNQNPDTEEIEIESPKVQLAK